jgi:hypothetical protein
VESDNSNDLGLDNIADLQEMGWDGLDRIDVAQDRDTLRSVVHAVMNLMVP